MAPAFSKPQHSQNSSRLCQLPPEIRLMILRELLLFPDCSEKNNALEYVHTRNDALDEQGNQVVPTIPYLKDIKASIKTGLSLSQSCQLLYNEASHVFYAENTLLLTPVAGALITSLPVVVGQCDLSPWPKTWRPFSTRPDLSTRNAPIQWKSFVYEKREYRSGKKAVEMFHKFQNIKIIFKELDDRFRKDSDQERSALARWMAKTCRWFRDILSSKNVEFETPTDCAFDPHSDHELLLGCRILECKSFKLNGKPAAKHISKYITGGEKVRDAFTDWCALYNNVIWKLPIDRIVTIDPDGVRDENIFTQLYQRELCSLENRVLLCDSVAVSAQIEIALREAKKWIAVWAETQTLKLASRKGKLMAKVDQTNRQLGILPPSDSSTGSTETGFREEHYYPAYKYAWK